MPERPPSKVSTDCDIVRSGLEVFNRGDFEQALTFFHPEAEIDSSAAFFRHGPYRGPDGVRDFYRTIKDLFEYFRVEAREMFELEGHVVVRAHTRGRYRESGELVESDEVDVWRLRDGLAVSLRVYFEEDEALEELGLDAWPSESED